MINIMIKLFKKKEQARSVNEVIEEIHKTFYTEVDRLLAEAGIVKSTESDKVDLLVKADKLKALGFTQAKEAQEGAKEAQRISTLVIENEKNRTLMEAIRHFSFKYPNYKFITEDSVKKICEKYGLVYGFVSGYIGSVPDENLKHIEEFKIDVEDECFEERTTTMNVWGDTKVKYLNHTQNLLARENKPRHGSIYYIINYDLCPLEIAATQKDFNSQGMEVKNFKVSYPDPIVLKPVWFAGSKHYLVVTAWS